MLFRAQPRANLRVAGTRTAGSISDSEPPSRYSNPKPRGQRVDGFGDLGTLLRVSEKCGASEIKHPRCQAGPFGGESFGRRYRVGGGCIEGLDVSLWVHGRTGRVWRPESVRHVNPITKVCSHGELGVKGQQEYVTGGANSTDVPILSHPPSRNVGRSDCVECRGFAWPPWHRLPR